MITSCGVRSEAESDIPRVSSIYGTFWGGQEANFFAQLLCLQMFCDVKVKEFMFSEYEGVFFVDAFFLK